MPFDFESCAFWLDAITVGAFVLWFAGVLFVGYASRRVAATSAGEIELSGDQATVTRRIADALAQGAPGTPLQSVALDEVTASTVSWHAGPGFRHQGRLRVSGSGSRLRVSWELEGGNGLLTGARWVQACGLLVIGVLYWVLSTYVLPSQFRMQVMQMLQSIHVLWPPFLLAGLALFFRRRLGAEVERLVGNQRFDLDG